ncbi:MAG: Eco57I restriction-modification methylase domain-containing protein [Candidatus Binataceae bacterium]
MRGFVQTPPDMVDHMVDRLFRGGPPKRTDNLLDPGCGTGAFLAGVMRWCRKNNAVGPEMIGSESEPGRARQAQDAFSGIDRVDIRRTDFLTSPIVRFDFIIGNPPYVAIYSLSEAEKHDYRAVYETARGRFDLYLLFFERALKSLKPGGRMVFITPEKFLYVETAAPLRRLLNRVQIEEIEFVDEQSFGGLVTYPTITTVINRPPAGDTLVRLRDGTQRRCRLDGTAASWLPLIRDAQEHSHGPRLKDICIRVSCGVATGADDVFVREAAALEPELAAFARPTIAGRELTRPGEISHQPEHAMLIPYADDGTLLAQNELGALGHYLLRMRERLVERTCVRRKPWYAFHETPPLPDILRPKILCKDITERPHFWIDRKGSLVPRHSVYYIVPTNTMNIEWLCSYLNSQDAARWLTGHCQRAANGFLRLQSNILKAIPVPDELVDQHRHKPASKRQQDLPGLAGSESATIR